METGLRKVEYLTSRTKARIATYYLAKGSSSMESNNPDTLLLSNTPIDFFSVLKEFSKDPSIQLLSDLMTVKDNTDNTCTLDSSNLSQSEKNKISKGYKELREKGLVIRIKRGVYLINPRLSPPYPEFHDTVYLRWLQLTSTQE